MQVLLGGQKACRALQGHLAAFVRLRRYEHMPLQQLVHGVRISDIPVFSGAPHASDHDTAQCQHA